jgi:predicted transcriptional regulator
VRTTEIEEYAMIGTNTLVLALLIEERDETTGLVGPIKNEYIAVSVGVSTTTAAFAVAALQEFGLIQRVRRHRTGSLYRVHTGDES